MEVLAISSQANRYQQEASATNARMQILHSNIDQLRQERRSRRRAEIALLLTSTLGNNAQAFGSSITLINEIRANRQIKQNLQAQREELRTLEHRVRSATTKAGILINLARRAAGGYVYARHQAAYIVGLSTSTI